MLGWFLCPVPIPLLCLGAHDELPSHWRVRVCDKCHRDKCQLVLKEIDESPKKRCQNWDGPCGLGFSHPDTAPKLSFLPSIEIGNCIAVQVCMLQIPILVLFTIFYVSSPGGLSHGVWGTWTQLPLPACPLCSVQGKWGQCLLVLSPPWGRVAEGVRGDTHVPRQSVWGCPGWP